MDFGRPLLLEEGVATKCNIRFLERAATSDGKPGGADGENGEGEKASIDDLLTDAANEAAVDLFLGPSSKPPPRRKKETDDAGSSSAVDATDTATADAPPSLEDRGDLRLVDCRLYPERSLPLESTIRPGALVVIFESFDNLNFVYVQPSKIFANRNGAFHHDDFLGQPFGCRVRARSAGSGWRGGPGKRGHVYLLRPTPELWTRSLNHRTQIVHELDAAYVIFQLHLRPNMVMVESGTGSGAMSHAIMRTIAPMGMLHTFEFNKHRVTEARREFEQNGVGHLVNVHWRDVCGKGEAATEGNGDGAAEASATEDGAEANGKDSSAGDEDKKSDDEEKMGHGGFHPLGPSSAHAVFLDLPEPWLAVPDASGILKPDGRLCSYSPCLEQVQKTIAALIEEGFHSLRTVEVRLKEHYVDGLELDGPPRDRLPREPKEVVSLPQGGVGRSPAGLAKELTAAAAAAASAESDARATSDADGGGGATTGGAEADDDGTPASQTDGSGVVNTSSRGGRKKSGRGDWKRNRKRLKKLTDDASGENYGGGAADDGDDNNNDEGGDEGTRKFLVARPYSTMRGHTAFLTFATRRVGPRRNATVST